MKEIAKQQEEIFFIATDWDKTDDCGRPDNFHQESGSSVNAAVNKYMENTETYPKYVYVVSKQLVAQAPNYI